MAESGNIFENFIDTFYVKFGKLQIKGFHGKAQTITFHPAFSRSVDPRRRTKLNHESGTSNNKANSVLKNTSSSHQKQLHQSSKVVGSHVYGSTSSVALRQSASQQP